MDQEKLGDLSMSRADLNIVGVIPARYASTRFPGKPLVKIAGKEMLLHVVDQALKAEALSQVFVATDDHRIFNLVKEKSRAIPVMTSESCPSGTDRIFEVSQKYSADVFVNIQGDEPLVNPDWISSLGRSIVDDIDMATLGHLIDGEDLQNLNSVKVLVNQLGNAIYFSRFPIPFSRKEQQSHTSFCLKHIGMYAYHRDFLSKLCQQNPSEIELAESLEQLRALDMGAKIKVIQVEGRSQGVDVPEDIAKVLREIEIKNQIESRNK